MYVYIYIYIYIYICIYIYIYIHMYDIHTYVLCILYAMPSTTTGTLSITLRTCTVTRSILHHICQACAYPAHTLTSRV